MYKTLRLFRDVETLPQNKNISVENEKEIISPLTTVLQQQQQSWLTLKRHFVKLTITLLAVFENSAAYTCDDPGKIFS